MNISQLKVLLDSEPLNAARTDEAVLDWCITPSVTAIKETMVTERSLMADLGVTVADTIMTKLETVSLNDSVISRVVSLMKPSESGIDLGNPEARGMIDQLAANNILTQTEAISLKSLSEHVVSPFENSGNSGKLILAYINQARAL